MKILFLILVLFLSGCTSKFYPGGDMGKRIEYNWGNQVCDRCHKKTIFFKIMNKKKVICADCYEKVYI